MSVMYLFIQTNGFAFIYSAYCQKLVEDLVFNEAHPVE